jgi:hypothetical protein
MYGIILESLTDEELLRVVNRANPVIKELAERLEYSNDQLKGYERAMLVGRKNEKT